MISPKFNLTGDEARYLLEGGLVGVDAFQLRQHPEYPSFRDLIRDGKIRYDQNDPDEKWQSYRELMEQVAQFGFARGDCEDFGPALAASDRHHYGVDSHPYPYQPAPKLFHVVTAVPVGAGRFGATSLPLAKRAPDVPGYVLEDPSAATGMGTSGSFGKLSLTAMPSVGSLSEDSTMFGSDLSSLLPANYPREAQEDVREDMDRMDRNRAKLVAQMSAALAGHFQTIQSGVQYRQMDGARQFFVTFSGARERPAQIVGKRVPDAWARAQELAVRFGQEFDVSVSVFALSDNRPGFGGTAVCFTFLEGGANPFLGDHGAHFAVLYRDTVPRFGALPLPSDTSLTVTDVSQDELGAMRRIERISQGKVDVRKLQQSSTDGDVFVLMVNHLPNLYIDDELLELLGMGQVKLDDLYEALQAQEERPCVLVVEDLLPTSFGAQNPELLRQYVTGQAISAKAREQATKARLQRRFQNRRQGWRARHPDWKRPRFERKQPGQIASAMNAGKRKHACSPQPRPGWEPWITPRGLTVYCPPGHQDRHLRRLDGNGVRDYQPPPSQGDYYQDEGYGAVQDQIEDNEMAYGLALYGWLDSDIDHEEAFGKLNLGGALGHLLLPGTGAGIIANKLVAKREERMNARAEDGLTALRAGDLDTAGKKAARVEILLARIRKEEPTYKPSETVRELLRWFRHRSDPDYTQASAPVYGPGYAAPLHGRPRPPQYGPRPWEHPYPQHRPDPRSHPAIPPRLRPHEDRPDPRSHPYLPPRLRPHEDRSSERPLRAPPAGGRPQSTPPAGGRPPREDRPPREQRGSRGVQNLPPNQYGLLDEPLASFGTHDTTSVVVDFEESFGAVFGDDDEGCPSCYDEDLVTAALAADDD